MQPVVDSAYAKAPTNVPLLAHGYGENVSLVHDPLLLRELAWLSGPGCELPALAELTRKLYRRLLDYLIVAAWPRERIAWPTRMHAQDPARGVWCGEVAAAAPPCVVAGIARAGTVPAQACAEALWGYFGQNCARQDHLMVARDTGTDGRVKGATVHVSKIGGDVHGRWLLLPDPMGATGHSMAQAVATYRQRPGGGPARIFAMHLIVTPEYLAHMQATEPTVEVWALRLDRAAGAPSTLATKLGHAWSAEKGLNEHAYILPGAGGVGEALNHADI